MDAFRAKVLPAIEGFPPAYFAMVMATGIVSIGSHLLGYEIVGLLLFWLNMAFYIALWVLTAARLSLYFDRCLADLNDHSRGAGYLTSVAGTCILGNQFSVIGGNFTIAAYLFALGLFLWVFLLYIIFASFSIRAIKPGLEAGINGTWLLSIVSTQSLSVLSGLLALHPVDHREVVLFFSLCMFLLGCMLYIMIITLIFYRLMFFELHPEQVGHPYWINMGAVAITTLAGATLIMNSPLSTLLTMLLPFTTGFTLLFWATATWWIPFLLLLGAWRFIVHRSGFSYDPQYWSMVFPLGMYTVATLRLAGSANLEYLLELPHYLILIALLAWSLTFLGLLRAIVRIFRPEQPGR
jgi:tellurite resistance protein TehA-like permease